MNGQGVTKDLSKAIALYQMSADLGKAEAQLGLGIFYSTGMKKKFFEEIIDFDLELENFLELKRNIFFFVVFFVLTC